MRHKSPGVNKIAQTAEDKDSVSDSRSPNSSNNHIHRKGKDRVIRELEEAIMNSCGIIISSYFSKSSVLLAQHDAHCMNLCVNLSMIDKKINFIINRPSCAEMLLLSETGSFLTAVLHFPISQFFFTFSLFIRMQSDLG